MTTIDYKLKYEQAREVAQRLYNNSVAITKKGLEDIFPELQESEDERVREELITHCRNTRCATEEGAERIAKWIAWLEKQGEPKEYTFKSLPRLFDMIEPTSKAKAYCQKLIDTLAKE